MGTIYDLDDIAMHESVNNIPVNALLHSLETLPQLVWMASADGTVFYYNTRIKYFHGAEQLPGGDWKWQGLLHDEDVVPTKVAWSKSLQTGIAYEIEHRAKMADGSYRWHLSRAFPQKDKEGKIVRWFGTSTDIDDQKRFAENLETLVMQRTLDLQRSNEELQQFAHTISHDLKEPLRKIRTFSNMLQEEFTSSFPDKTAVYLEKIKGSADRMNKMIEGVLEYATVNTTKEEFEIIDPDEVIKKVKDDLELVIKQKNAVINYKGLSRFEGSSIRIYQLFYNLINNSLKFAKEDITPVIDISSRMLKREQENLTLHDLDDCIEINFSDNGIGFDQEFSEKIFNTFYRLNSKHKYEGTGLGLSLCKKIVLQHNGTISAKSEEGKGATFIIVLPVTQSKSEKRVSIEN